MQTMLADVIFRRTLVRTYKHEKEHASNHVYDVAMGHFQRMPVAWNSEKLLAEAPQSSAQYAVENRHKNYM